MRINHNIPALNAHRILNRNNVKSSGVMERLSSGRRINRAKDDAAGMAISEKMKTQIRGLRKASQNTLDGISLIQTAEGAMNEVHSMLQRMRELAVQSANGTTTDDDRFAIQEEVNQLTSEVNRIANGTEFNTRQLLRGNEAPNSNTVVHRLSTGAPAVVEGVIDTDVDLRSEFLTITVDGNERTVRLNSIDENASLESRLDVISSALGDLGTAVSLTGNKFEIRTESIGGLSNITIEGSSAALQAYGLYQGIITGKAEVDAGNAEGTVYFDGLPERGSTITIGNTKIEFYDSSVAPYTGSNRPIDIFDQATGDYISEQDIIDTITDMEFPGIESIVQDTTGAGAVIFQQSSPSVLEVPGEYSFSIDEEFVSGDVLTIDGFSGITFGSGQNIVESGIDAQGSAIATHINDNLGASGQIGEKYEASYDSGTNKLTFIERTGQASAEVLVANVSGDGVIGEVEELTAGVETSAGVYQLSITQLFESGDTIVFNGVTYEFGTDFSGDTINVQAQNLAAAIASYDDQFESGSIEVDGDGNITLTEAIVTGDTIDHPTVDGNSLVNRIRFTAEAEGFAGQAVYIEGTPKQFVANLQIGPNQGQGFRLSVGDIRADRLMISSTSPDGNTGVTGAAFSQYMEVTDGMSEQKIQYAVDVSNEERATAAITVYNNAIVQVAQMRGELGAIQNRLEYTSANLDNTQENMTAALSRIEDADMALEMSEFTKMNIMLQAGTSMLAQANQQPQMVLQLLQG
ncbi:MAG: hypothetical protein D5S00_02905 [Tindallia sp. MSAO_Bac2]|nr:MAG: hypothetical protein D5S00_02905 [Tindallia sp. MSAO_Bac2]